MNEMEFRKAYLGEFKDNSKLYDIAIAYHYLTEGFDRMILGENEKTIPTRGLEYSVVLAFAGKIMMIARERAKRLGFSSSEFQAAILEISGYEFRELSEIAKNKEGVKELLSEWRNLHE